MLEQIAALVPQERQESFLGTGRLPVLAHGQPDWTVAPKFAFAALVEFGGSGGRVSGPLARRIARTLVDYDSASTDMALAAPESTLP